MAYILLFVFIIVIAAYGALYLAFAFREPPEALVTYFRVPSIFIFWPDETRMKYGRISMGVLFIAAALSCAGSVIHSFLSSL
jgi:hypothetical protein